MEEKRKHREKRALSSRPWPEEDMKTFLSRVSDKKYLHVPAWQAAYKC